MIRARGNNPLKFSADDDDALAALIGIGRRTDMSPAEAVADALRDMRLHELATIAAMQSAVRALVARLRARRPARRRRAGRRHSASAGARRRAPGTPSRRCTRNVARLVDDFDCVFGKAFARAYEKALAEASPAGQGPMRASGCNWPRGAGAGVGPGAGRAAARRPPPPAMLDLAVQGSAEQNPSPSGTAQPVAVHLYQLASTAKFERADVFALVERERRRWARTCRPPRNSSLSPAEKQTIKRELKKGAQFARRGRAVPRHRPREMAGDGAGRGERAEQARAHRRTAVGRSRRRRK